MASNTSKEKQSVSNVDDNQLTIRIPNPKMYMARQSLWTGHRGKPRCDHCRLNNLKCDRVLPTCNHCLWGMGRECKYTPLPTPAHRGIPRCDRCRLKNLKCDRNLPICNHCSEQDEMDCNYTPKKRNRLSMDHTMTLNTPDDIDAMHQPFFVATNGSLNPAHTFYGQNIASSSNNADSRSKDSPPSDSERQVDSEIPRTQTGRFTAELAGPSCLKQKMPAIVPRATPLPFIAHSFSSEQAVVLSSSVVEPWHNSTFPPLPLFMAQRLRLINSVEIPGREPFNSALKDLLGIMMVEIRETACLNIEMYSQVARCLQKKDLRVLPERLRSWLTFHHVCIGSARGYLLLMPRDVILTMAEVEAEKARKEYCESVDDSGSTTKVNGSATILFDRIPVQPQIYDILTYAHRSHASPSDMTEEIKRLGYTSISWTMAEMYTRLCPLCKIQNQHGP